MKPVTVGTGLAIAGAAHAAVNAVLSRRPTEGPVRSRVSVLIPARDEADCIGTCLDSIDGADEVLVLDDGSRDTTAEVARAHGARVLSGTSLPSGWLGKPHACAQLAAAASGEVLVFVDADVQLRPGAIRAAVHFLESSGWDLVSPHPRQATGSVAERLVQPLLQWSILTTLPLRLAERSQRPSLAAANGQFLVVRRDAYERAGGHVPDAVLDDLALVRTIKRSGGRGGIVDGTSLATCRMYGGWTELRDGYGKSLWSAFGSPVGSSAVVGALIVRLRRACRGGASGLSHRDDRLSRRGARADDLGATHWWVGAGLVRSPGVDRAVRVSHGALARPARSRRIEVEGPRCACCWFQPGEPPTDLSHFPRRAGT